MTDERTLTGPAWVLAPIGTACLSWGIAYAERLPPVWLVLVFGSIAVWADDWPHWVGRKMAWSNSAPVLIAAVVLAPPTTAPIVGAAVLMPTAIFAVERQRFAAARFWTNLGHLAVDGFLTGLVVEVVRGDAHSTSITMIAAGTIAYIASVALSICVVGLISLYRLGSSSAIDLAAIARSVPARELPVVVGAAALATVAISGGAGWIALLAPALVAFASLTITNAKLAKERTALITVVRESIGASETRSAVHDRLDRSSLAAGRHLRLSPDELQQLRYVAMSYAMTDGFANRLVKPIDHSSEPTVDDIEFSLVLLEGLGIDDTASPLVVALGDAAAQLDALLHPEPGVDALGPQEALGELRRQGVEADLVDALKMGLDDESYYTWYPRLAQGFPSGRS